MAHILRDPFGVLSLPYDTKLYYWPTCMAETKHKWFNRFRDSCGMVLLSAPGSFWGEYTLLRVYQ
jgi:hypothetical protein